MVDWTGRGASSDVLAIDTKDVNGGLALRLETALRVVRSNNLSRRRKSAAGECRPPYDRLLREALRAISYFSTYVPNLQN